MKYLIEQTTQFKKDIKLAKKRHLPLEPLKEIVALLANGEQLPDKVFLPESERGLGI